MITIQRKELSVLSNGNYIFIFERKRFHVCTIIDSRSMKKYQSFDQINENISNNFILMEYHLLDTNN